MPEFSPDIAASGILDKKVTGTFTVRQWSVMYGAMGLAILALNKILHLVPKAASQIADIESMRSELIQLAGRGIKDGSNDGGTGGGTPVGDTPSVHGDV